MRKPFAAAVAVLSGLAVCSVVLGAVASPGPSHVGELERVSIATAHPYASGSWERTVSYPGATYIRIHFSAFDLAPGDSLEIAGPAGIDVYTLRGPHGTGEFWAFAVDGDTAVIRLNAPAGGGFGLAIDGFGRGTVAIGEPGGGPGGSTDSVCGTQDWRDVECYNPSTEYEKSKGATLMLIGCCSSCTGFKASDSGQFLTNNHCTSTQSGVQSTEVRFNYNLSGCGSGTSGYSARVFGSALQQTNALLDYTLFTTSGDASSIPCLEIDNRLPPVGERIYIPGHPLGGVKKLSIASDQNAGGQCAVDAAPCAGNGATSDVCYYCDTTNGSSGSPVLSGSTNKVVALHHFGGCFNSGGRMDQIYPQISSLLTGCTGGPPAVCGDGVKGGAEQCDGADLGGATCQSRGYSGGTLSCTASCTFNTSQCTQSCVPVSKSRCNCDGICQRKEQTYISGGGVCLDCP